MWEIRGSWDVGDTGGGMGENGEGRWKTPLARERPPWESLAEALSLSLYSGTSDNGGRLWCGVAED